MEKVQVHISDAHIMILEYVMMRNHLPL
jgi:hypothetical protein